jgi:translation initiation factor IF-2
MKIFELAKELDVKPLDLVESLKGVGLSVRNHMSALSEDDVTKYRGFLAKTAAEAAEVTTKKKMKKKTTKKKVAKKKVSAKDSSTTKKTKKVSASKKKVGKKAAPEKIVTVKKNIVIRKKSPSKVSAPVVEEVLEAAATPIVQEIIEAEVQESGLRVVSQSPAAKVEEVAPTEDEKKYLDDKAHRFTPVYIPPKDESAKAKEGKAEEGEAKPKAEGGETAEGSDDEKKTEDATKKRFGGLAAMMSGKKVAVNRSRNLNETKSEAELKSYAALSNLGRPLYSQVKRKKNFIGAKEKTLLTETKESKRYITLHKGGFIHEIANKLSIKTTELIDAVLEINLLVTKDDYIGIKLAEKIAELFDFRVEDVAFKEDEIIAQAKFSDDEKSKLPSRNPIMTIMGHVDHGKTTLLDHIRKAKVADAEAGGITQHIGAYSVKVKDKTLTFLDTPGHAAFASMRQRGADITDIVILVVAADDGVMPQTKESIRFCKNANKPLIVAINKMDKEGANPERIKQALTEFEITPEEWGGDTQFVEISALKGDGVDNLLESIALQAEILELRANAKGKAEGIVIESLIEQGRGPVATILVQKGTLKKGDAIVCGESYGRARSLMDETGKIVDSAGPSTPVQVLGLSQAPTPGDCLNVLKNEREAKKIVENRINERKELDNSVAKKTMSLEDFFSTHQSDSAEKRMLNLLIRTDVQGSFEAIKQSLEVLGNSEVDIKVIGGGVGPITDNDVNMASSSTGYIIGFNMRPVTSARKLAEQNGIDVKTYTIIYELINDVKLALEGLLEPEFNEEYSGRAEVKETFSVPRIGLIAGSAVIDGNIKSTCNIRLLREGKIMFDGKLSSLKRFKDDVKEVKNGYECGIGLENYNDIKVGDLFEAYSLIEYKRTLEDVAKEEAEKAKKDAEEAERLEIELMAEMEVEAAGEEGEEASPSA